MSILDKIRGGAGSYDNVSTRGRRKVPNSVGFIKPTVPGG